MKPSGDGMRGFWLYGPHDSDHELLEEYHKNDIDSLVEIESDFAT
jgi:hypothetical protein